MYAIITGMTFRIKNKEKNSLISNSKVFFTNSSHNMTTSSSKSSHVIYSSCTKGVLNRGGSWPVGGVRALGICGSPAPGVRSILRRSSHSVQLVLPRACVKLWIRLPDYSAVQCFFGLWHDIAFVNYWYVVVLIYSWFVSGLQCRQTALLIVRFDGWCHESWF